MPATPYAKLFVSLNSGALQDGGVTAAVSDTVDLSAESTVGWPASGAGAPKWEIYGFPPSFTVPAGWSTDGTTGAYYYTGVTPPQFTITYWGKYMLRLLVQGGGGDKTDESTAISVPDASGLLDLGKYETTQFNDGWDDDQRANLRIVAAGLGVAKAPADAQYLVGAANGDLSAEVVWTSIGTTVAFASTATQPCTFSRTDSGTTNTALTARTLIALGGTVANGFGVQEVYQAEGAGGTAIDAGSVAFTWVDITGGSEDSKCTIGVRTGGAVLASCAEFSGSGSTLIRHAATTNDTLPLLTLRRTTSDAGFGATGIGGSVVFELEDGAGNTDTAATVAVDYLDATSTSEDTRWLFRGQVAGSLTDLLSLRGQTMRIHGLAGGGSQLLIVDNNGDVSASTSALPAPLTLAVDDATSNDVSTVLTLRHTYNGGNGTAGIGSRLVFEAEDAGGNAETAAYITGRFTTATNGAEVSEVGLWTRNAGALTKNLTVAGDGTTTLAALAGAATRITTASTTGALGTVSGTAGLVTVASSGAPTVSNPAILVNGTVPANVSNGLNTQALTSTVTFLCAGNPAVVLAHSAAATNSVLTCARILRVVDSSAGAAGVGAALSIDAPDDAGNEVAAGSIGASLTTVTEGAHVGQIALSVASAGALVERATLSSAGVWTTDGKMQSDGGFDRETAGTAAFAGATATGASIGSDATSTANDYRVTAGGTHTFRTNNISRLAITATAATFGTDTVNWVVGGTTPYNGGDSTGAVTIDFSRANIIEVGALVDNVTFTISGAVVGANYTVIVRQHASSAKTTTWSNGLFASGDDAIGTTVNTYTAWQFAIMTGGTIVCIGVKKDIVIP